MAFGSIVAVTDSFGVVQVLKSSGAREALTVPPGLLFGTQKGHKHKHF